ELRRLDRGVGRGQGVLITTTDVDHAQPGLRRRVARAFARHERLRLGLELTAPVIWLVVLYTGSFLARLVPAFYRLNGDPTVLLDRGGGALHEVFGHTPGFGFASTTIVLSYQWFPYMVIPLYAGLERLPDSLLEASTDLGAKAGRTFRSIVLPQLRPALIAGS